MRRFFYIIVLVAALVAFFRSDLSSDLFNSGDIEVTNWFNRISDAAEEKVMADFREQAEPIFSGLRSHQVEYAEHLMKDRETLGVFYLKYCKTDEANPYIFGQTRTEFCEQIKLADILRKGYE